MMDVLLTFIILAIVSALLSVSAHITSSGDEKGDRE